MCKIVFIRKTFLGDTIIRGHLTDLAFAQLGLRCKSEVVHVEWFANLVKLNRTLTMAYNGHRKPWVAYFVKEAWLPEPDLAHLVGAYAVFDVIDNVKRSRVWPNTSNDMGTTNVVPNNAVDLYLVNTRWHASVLNDMGVAAAPFAHPHANLRLLEPNYAPPKIDPSRLGMMVSQVANTPNSDTLLRLAAQACDAGMQLTLYQSRSNGVREIACPGPLLGEDPTQKVNTCPDLACRSLVGPQWTEVPLTTAGNDASAAACSGNLYSLPPPLRANYSSWRHGAADARALQAMRGRDEIARKQNGYYEWGRQRLPAAAVVWEPPFGNFEAYNRPQTRQVWWWSFGVPTLSSQKLQSAQDAGARAGMPRAVRELTLDGAESNLTAVLRCLRATPSIRSELQARALNDARHASSIASAARELQSLLLQLHAKLGAPPPANGQYRHHFEGALRAEETQRRKAAESKARFLAAAVKQGSRAVGTAAAAHRQANARRISS